MKPQDLVFPLAALRTIHASRWTLWCARMFGRKVVGEDSGNRVVGYEWRDKLYMTDAGRRSR